MKLTNEMMPFIKGQMEAIEGLIILNFKFWHEMYIKVLDDNEDFYTSKNFKFIRSRIKNQNNFGNLYSEWIMDILVAEFKKSEVK
jgi:hypothetical protein|tara:strand:- start:2979 stop:3233 length:255 start_codon:yes stop_codon:yes gene_type:complete